MYHARMKTVESIIHRVQSQSVHHETCEVFSWHEGFVPTQSRPLHSELSGDIVHIVEHAADYSRAKCRHEYSVSNIPVLLVQIRLEPSGFDFDFSVKKCIDIIHTVIKPSLAASRNSLNTPPGTLRNFFSLHSSLTYL